MCGGPAEEISTIIGNLVACPCVPRDRVYCLPTRLPVPLIASQHVPEGTVVLKVKPV